MSDQWYIARNNKKHGPFTTAKLKELAAKGRLLPTDMLHKDGMAKWVAASAVKGLFLAAAASPAVPTADGDKFQFDATSDNPKARRTQPSSKKRLVILSAAGGGVLLLTLLVVVLAVVFRARTPAAGDRGDDRIAQKDSRPSDTAQGGSTKEQPGQPNQKGRPEPPKSAASDIPEPAFNLSAQEIPPVDFSKVDYSKGPNGENVESRHEGRWHGFVDRKSGLPVRHGLEIVYYVPKATEGLKDKASETYYFYGMKHGLEQTWHEDGKRKSIAMWYEGKLHGKCELWHSNGKKAGECVYVKGAPQGHYILWHDTGNKKEEKVYKDGKPDGPYVEWYSTGQRMTQGTYKNGVKDAELYGWYKNGQVQWKQTHRSWFSVQASCRSRRSSASNDVLAPTTSARCYSTRAVGNYSPEPGHAIRIEHGSGA